MMASGSRSVRDRDDGDGVHRAFGTVDMEVRLIMDNEKLRQELKESRKKVVEQEEHLRGMKAELDGLAEQLVAMALGEGNTRRDDDDDRGRRENEEKLRGELQEAKLEVESVRKILEEKEVELRGMNGVVTGQSNRLRDLEKEDVRKRKEHEDMRNESESARKRLESSLKKLENAQKEFENMQNELDRVQTELERTKEDHKKAVQSLNQMAASRKTKGEEYQASMASKVKMLEDVRKQLTGAEEDLQNVRKQVTEKDELLKKADLKSTELAQIVEALKKDVEVARRKVTELKHELAMFKGQKGHYELRLSGMSELLNRKDKTIEYMRSTVQSKEKEVNALEKLLELASAKSEKLSASPVEKSKTPVVSITANGRAVVLSATALTSKDKDASPVVGKILQDSVSEEPDCDRSMSGKRKLSPEDIQQQQQHPSKKANFGGSRSSTEISSSSETSSDDTDSDTDDDDDGEQKKLDCVGGALVDPGRAPPRELEGTSKTPSSSSHSMNSESKAVEDDTSVKSAPEANSNAGSASVAVDDMSEFSLSLTPLGILVKQALLDSDDDDDDDLDFEDSSNSGSSSVEVMSNHSDPEPEDERGWTDLSDNEDEANPPPAKSESTDGVISSQAKLATPLARMPRFVMNSRPHGKDPDPNRPFFCICGGDYGTAHALQHHIRYFQDGKPYSCDSCGESFRTRDHLKRHKKRHHPEPATM